MKTPEPQTTISRFAEQYQFQFCLNKNVVEAVLQNLAEPPSSTILEDLFFDWCKKEENTSHLRVHNESTIHFYFTAYRHGYTSGGSGVSSGHQHVFFGATVGHLFQYLMDRNDDGNSFLEPWFLFVTWVRLGSWHLLLDTTTTTTVVESPVQASKALTLEEWEKECPFEDVAPKKASSFCVFISHRWHALHHPDPTGEEKRRILPLLRHSQQMIVSCCRLGTDASSTTDLNITRGIMGAATNSGIDSSMLEFCVSSEYEWATLCLAHHQKELLVWYDFYSVPQGPDKRATRAKCLQEIDRICRVMPVLAVPSQDYFSRAWCFFECLQGQLGPERNFLRFYISEDKSPTNDLFLEKRIASFHGRFCQQLELMSSKSNPETLLTELGVTCTNGTDLGFLSHVLTEPSRCNPACPGRIVSYVHPFLTAWWIVFEQRFAPDQNMLDPAGYRHLFEFLCRARRN